MTHHDPVIGTCEQILAIPQRGHYSFFKTIFHHIPVQVPECNRINLHCMNTTSTARHRDREVTDAGIHVGYPFIFGTGAHQLGDPHLLNPVPLGKHHFTRIKYVRIPVFTVPHFPNVPPEELCPGYPGHIVQGFNPEYTPRVTKSHYLINFFFAGFFTVDDSNITYHKKSFSLVPRPPGDLVFTGGVIPDRDPCRVSVNIRSLCRVDPAFSCD